MIRHPTLTPEQYREQLQTHLDEVLFVLIVADPSIARVAEVFRLRNRVEQLLDAAVLPSKET